MICGFFGFCVRAHATPLTLLRVMYLYVIQRDSIATSEGALHRAIDVGYSETFLTAGRLRGRGLWVCSLGLLFIMSRVFPSVDGRVLLVRPRMPGGVAGGVASRVKVCVSVDITKVN